MEEKVYEMLWDCRYCGTARLLGKTHRHCPSCGAPQENAPRYFPPDDEKVAVADHQYFGADVVCPHCAENQSRNSKHCGACGGPLDGSKDVARRRDVVVADGVAFQGDSVRAAQNELRGVVAAPAPAAKSNAGKIILAVLGLGFVSVVALLLVFLFWKRAGGFDVVEQTWERSVVVERYGPVEKKAWCDELPPKTEVISKRQQKRSTKKVEDGEDCQTRKVDNGDGTYTEKRECQPRFKDEPVMGEECTYQVHHWISARTETSRGAAGQPPTWPAVRLAREGQCVGCEREGSRREIHRVVVVPAGGGERTPCEVDPERWVKLTPKTRVKGEVRVLGGGVVCDSLAPQ